MEGGLKTNCSASRASPPPTDPTAGQADEQMFCQNTSWCVFGLCCATRRSSNAFVGPLFPESVLQKQETAFPCIFWKATLFLRLAVVGMEMR